MQVSFTEHLEGDRQVIAIGRVKATTRWRAVEAGGAETDRDAALRALTREAEDFGADALVDVRFATDEVKGADIDGLALQRVTASGLAVRFALAA